MVEKPEAVHMLPSPAVSCTGCGFSWNSAAMAEGLRLLGSCPKCNGELRFAAEAEPPGAAVEPRIGTRAPHLVLGLPRR